MRSIDSVDGHSCARNRFGSVINRRFNHHIHVQNTQQYQQQTNVEHSTKPEFFLFTSSLVTSVTFFDGVVTTAVSFTFGFIITKKVLSSSYQCKYMYV